jgi:ATP synthase F1 complex assembly factor 1
MMLASRAIARARSHSRLFQMQRHVNFTNITDQQQKEIADNIIKEVSAKQSLDALVKDFTKFKTLEPEQMKSLWTSYHEDKPFAIAGDTLDPTTWIKIKERATMSPFFVLPNVRGRGIFFVMLTEYKEDFVLMTFLDDYRRVGSNANPWCSISFFPEVDTMTLVQTKFSPYLKKEEAKVLANRWIEFYNDDKLFEEKVWTFNKVPDQFNFTATFPETLG